MVGCHNRDQTQLFYAFDLDGQMPADHLLRKINHHLELESLRSHLADYYSHTGRPSIAPKLMFRMLIVGYCYGTRSERQLCEEVQLNLAYRWLFTHVVGQCITAGLVKGDGVAADASIIPTDASTQHRARGSTDDLRKQDAATTSRAVRDNLETLDQSEELARKSVSLTDPQAQWTAAKRGPAIFAYSTNYLMDTEDAIIVDVEATPAHGVPQVESTKTMLTRVEKDHGIKPKRLLGDTAYGTAAMPGWMVEEKQIETHVPMWDKSKRKDGTLSSSAFVWNADSDEYRCPAGQYLRPRQRAFAQPRSTVTKAQTIIYRASKQHCDACPLKVRCCPNTPARKITRSIYEEARDRARKIAKSPEYGRSIRERRKVEMLFGHLKRIMRFERLRLRGLNGASDEFLMATCVQNLRKLAKL